MRKHKRTKPVIAAVAAVFVFIIGFVWVSTASAHTAEGHSANCTNVSFTLANFPEGSSQILITGKQGGVPQGYANETLNGPSGTVSTTWTQLGIDTSAGGTYTYEAQWLVDGGGSDGPYTFDASSCVPPDTEPPDTTPTPPSGSVSFMRDCTEPTVLNGTLTLNNYQGTNGGVTVTIGGNTIDKQLTPIQDGQQFSITVPGLTEVAVNGTYTIFGEGDQAFIAGGDINLAVCETPPDTTPPDTTPENPVEPSFVVLGEGVAKCDNLHTVYGLAQTEGLSEEQLASAKLFITAGDETVEAVGVAATDGNTGAIEYMASFTQLLVPDQVLNAYLEVDGQKLVSPSFTVIFVGCPPPELIPPVTQVQPQPNPVPDPAPAAPVDAKTGPRFTG